MCLNIGILIASFIGGTFGSSKMFPRLVETFPLLETYPYLLPNLLAAILPLVAAVVAMIWLKETLPSIVSGPESDSEDTLIGSDDATTAKEDQSLSSLFTPHINKIMISFAILSLLGSAQIALQPLFAFTPIRDGGLGFGEKEIGWAMSIRSVATIAVQLLAFPVLQRHVGTNRLYRWIMVLWLPTYLGLPLCNLLARGGNLTAVWLALSTTLLCSAVANMSFGVWFGCLHLSVECLLMTVCNLLMTNAAAPSRQLLGTINGECLVDLSRKPSSANTQATLKSSLPAYEYSVRAARQSYTQYPSPSIF